jgi:hypothetical protein
MEQTEPNKLKVKLAELGWKYVPEDNRTQSTAKDFSHICLKELRKATKAQIRLAGATVWVQKADLLNKMLWSL